MDLRAKYTRGIAVMLLGWGAHATADVDVTALIPIENAWGTASSSAGRFDRRTGQMRYTASLTNVTSSMITGPLYVTVKGISAPGVFDMEHDEQFSDGRGAYRVYGDLDPDETVKRQLTFHNPER